MSENVKKVKVNILKSKSLLVTEQAVFIRFLRPPRCRDERFRCLQSDLACSRTLYILSIELTALQKCDFRNTCNRSHKLCNAGC